MCQGVFPGLPLRRVEIQAVIDGRFRARAVLDVARRGHQRVAESAGHIRPHAAAAIVRRIRIAGRNVIECSIDGAGIQVDRFDFALLNRIVAVIADANVDAVAQHERRRIADLFVQRARATDDESSHLVSRLPDQRAGGGIERKHAAAAKPTAEFAAGVIRSAAIRRSQDD